jgi:hypothetical protein
MNIGNGKSKATKFPNRSNQKANISTVKYQTCRLMRMLVQVIINPTESLRNL